MAEDIAEERMRTILLWTIIVGALSAIVTISFTTRIPNDILRWSIESSEGGYLLSEGRYSINPYAFGIIISIILLSLVAVAANVTKFFASGKDRAEMRTLKAIRAQANKKQSEIDKTRNDLKRMATSSGVSSTQVKPLHALTAIHYKFLILDKYDGDVDAKFSIRAQEEMLFWEFWIEADEYAKEIKNYGDLEIDFKLLNADNRDLAWFPISIRNNRLTIMIAFFPLLKSGETAEVQLRYKWPGFFNRLKETGADSIYWSAQTADPHCLVEAKIEVVASKKTKRIKCVNAGNKLSSESLLSSHDGKVWTYQAHSNFGGKHINLAVSFD